MVIKREVGIMEDSKTTFYQRHPILTNAAITIGLVGIVGGGAAIYQVAHGEKEFSKPKKEIAEKYNPARDVMPGTGMQMRMREQMPMPRMGMNLERMLGGEMTYLKPETRQAFKELYQRNQEFMKKYNELVDKYKGNMMNYRKEFIGEIVKLTEGYLTIGQELKGQEAVRAIGDIKPPKLLKQVEPIYPEAARKAGIEGIVILEAKTDVNGHITNTKVLRSIPQLDQAATDAVKQWVYEPMVIEGKPKPVVFTVTVRFQLK